MTITHEMNMHNCQLCTKEWLGRCFYEKHYGKYGNLYFYKCCRKYGTLGNSMSEGSTINE